MAGQAFELRMSRCASRRSASCGKSAGCERSTISVVHLTRDKLIAGLGGWSALWPRTAEERASGHYELLALLSCGRVSTPMTFFGNLKTKMSAHKTDQAHFWEFKATQI